MCETIEKLHINKNEIFYISFRRDEGLMDEIIKLYIIGNITQKTQKRI